MSSLGKILFLTFILILEVSAQSNINFKDIKNKYESFEYSDVVRYSEIFLYNNENVEESLLIAILTMKAVSHYSLLQKSQAKKSFEEILAINKEHELNPSEVSPKIIQLFEQIKLRLSMVPETIVKKNKTITITDTLFNHHEIEIKTSLYQNSISRSVVLPGWGHLYLGNKSKGWLLTGLSTITLGSMIYYIAETNKLQNKYLNETNPILLEENYKEYNQSYKTRNMLIAGYIAIWLYSQIDILFLSDDLFEKNIKTELSISSQYNQPKVNLNFRFALH